MSSPVEVTLYTQPAYLIYREISSDQSTDPHLEAIPETDIVRLESSANYCYVYTVDGERTLMAMGLKWVIRHLQDFVRIHRSHAVNPLYIETYLLPKRVEDQGDRFLKLTTGERIPWSRRYLKDTRKAKRDLFRTPTSPAKKSKPNPP